MDEMEEYDEYAGISPHKLHSMIVKDPRLNGGLAFVQKKNGKLYPVVLEAMCDEASELALAYLSSAATMNLVKGTSFFSGLSCRENPCIILSTDGFEPSLDSGEVV